MSARTTRAPRAAGTRRAVPTTLADAVHAALDDVYDPCSQAWNRPLSVADLGLVRLVEVHDDGRIRIVISPTTLLCMAISVILQAVEAKVGAVPGVTSVQVSVDVHTEWTPDLMTDLGAAELAEHRRADRDRVFLPLAPVPPAPPALGDAA